MSINGYSIPQWYIIENCMQDCDAEEIVRRWKQDNQIMNVTSRKSEELKDGDYLVLESACVYHGLLDSEYQCKLTDVAVDNMASYGKIVEYHIPKFDRENFIETCPNGVKVPTVERSIIDLIRYDSFGNITDEAIVEAINKYKGKNKNCNKLFEVAKFYMMETEVRLWVDETNGEG